MSKTLQTLAAISAAKRVTRKAKDVARATKRKGEAAVAKTVDTARAAADTKPGRAAIATGKAAGRAGTGLVDLAAGTKPGIRRTAVYGGATPIAGLGAKRGTEATATGTSLVTGKAGSMVGLAAGGPVGMLVGGAVGGALGGAATQTEAGLRAAKAAGRGYRKVKKSVGGAVRKALKNRAADIKAGVRSAVGASVASDVSQAFGGKKVSRLKAFQKGRKASKMHREIKEDLGTLKSLSRRGRIKPAK